VTSLDNVTSDPIARDELLRVARDLIAHSRANTVPVADSVVEVPAQRYCDPEYFDREKRAIFQRLPIVVAGSREIPQPGDHMSGDIVGIPVLVVRGRDGVARAFLNACTHRGAILTSGSGSSARLKCPYHGWVFDDQGALVGVPCRKEFGEVDTDALGLRPFPVTERAGLVWAILDPTSTADIDQLLDTFLGRFGALLEEFGLKNWTVLRRASFEGANWKLAFDAHLDFYHLPVLHRNTFGPDVSPHAFYYHWGPHQRLARPGKRGGPVGIGNVDLFAQQDDPEDTWTNEAMMLGEWIIYPNVSINSFYSGGRGVLISQILPGETVDRSITVQTYFLEREPDETQRASAETLFEFLGNVVNGEDLPTSFDQQRALSTGMVPAMRFGRNEGGLQQFHKWCERIVTTPDDHLEELFREP
jgi:phenylpropionate dioxygenase-like ring-hydroxylating dioxygenase large terminal subunit